jgi:ATP-dependent Clp protease ATP-binding subunit ClpA
VTIHHAILTDEEFVSAVALAGGAWVERNYPDDAVDALHRLDELVNHRVIDPARAEALDERLERLTPERVAFEAYDERVKVTGRRWTTEDAA